MKESLDIKKIYNDLDTAVFNAIINPINEEELNQLISDAQVLDSKPESLNKRNKLKEKVSKSSVFCKNLPEFRHVLEKIGFTKERVENHLKHENSHGNMAEHFWIQHNGYVVVFLESHGQLAIKIAAEIEYNENNMPSQEVLQKIASAPEIYEKMELSEVDKQLLDHISKNIS